MKEERENLRIRQFSPLFVYFPIISDILLPTDNAGTDSFCGLNFPPSCNRSVTTSLTNFLRNVTDSESGYDIQRMPEMNDLSDKSDQS